MMSETENVRWLDELEAHAWTSYRRMKGMLDLHVARDLQADSGLSDPDYSVLSTLSETAGKDWRLRDLAERLSWSPSRLAHHLSRMERRELVIRGPSSGDPRGAPISLTEKGTRTVESAASPHVRSVRRHFVDVLSRDELSDLADIADKVFSHLNGVSRDQQTDATSATPARNSAHQP